MPPVASDFKTDTKQGADMDTDSQTTQPTLSSNQRSVIFWDWDDTLLCSSFLSNEGFRLDTDAERTEEMVLLLKELEASVISVLKLSMTYGEVHVVTNAETGWVQLSAQKFIPGVVPLLSKVRVLSARSTYEGMFPESPLKWKFYAFQEKLSKTFEDVEAEKNIISFGDSHVEREAVRAVTRGLPRTRTKSVKFAERPSVEQLQRQIELVTNCFQYIHDHEGDLDLCMSLSVTPNATEEQKEQEDIGADSLTKPAPAASAYPNGSQPIPVKE
jgi:hypothetical protein